MFNPGLAATPVYSLQLFERRIGFPGFFVVQWRLVATVGSGSLGLSPICGG